MPKLGLARIKGICLADNKASVKVQEVAILIKIPANTEQFYPLGHKSKICDRCLPPTALRLPLGHKGSLGRCRASA